MWWSVICLHFTIFFSLLGMLEMNRTRSSLHDHTTHDQDLESGNNFCLLYFYESAICLLYFLFTISDQSILDEHVDRVFNEDSKGHNVSTAFNQFESGSNRHLSASFSMGYRTLDRHHPAQSHFGKLFVYIFLNTTKFSAVCLHFFVYIFFVYIRFTNDDITWKLQRSKSS